MKIKLIKIGILIIMFGMFLIEIVENKDKLKFIYFSKPIKELKVNLLENKNNGININYIDYRSFFADWSSSCFQSEFVNNYKISLYILKNNSYTNLYEFDTLNNNVTSYKFIGYKSNTTYKLKVNSLDFFGNILYTQIQEITTNSSPFVEWNSNELYLNSQLVNRYDYAWTLQRYLDSGFPGPSLQDIDGSRTGWKLDSYAILEWLETEEYIANFGQCIYNGKLYKAINNVHPGELSPDLNPNWEFANGLN